ncbi:MAG: carbohydrate ABC transporter permease [Clostridia bacterium]|nr:carbohydrate ABC transporter permease [Clostridia bacterium]
MKIKRSLGERIFEKFNVLFMLLIAFIMAYPLLYVILASFSDPYSLMGHTGLLLKPLGFSVQSYIMMSKNEMILLGYINTLIIVFVGTTVNLFLTALGAYFLSLKGPMLKRPITLMIVLTMYFSGGMIPFYFTVTGLGIDNSYLALILPTAINTFNLIVMRTAFEAVPNEMRESAYIDGAGDWRVLFQFILPLSKATVAVVLLYYMVSHWNAWFNAVLFINDRELYPLQLVLREILIQSDTSSMQAGTISDDQFAVSQTIKYAVTVVATVPILCIYPFVQKYFEKGVMLGGVKG